MPAPYAPPVTLAAEEQAQLESLTRARATPQALAFRCRLILRSAAPDHPSNLRLAAEMRKANYASVRGPYRYGNNHFPIQNFYLQDVVKDTDGTYTLKTVATALKDHQDRYHAQCQMK